MTTNRRGFFRTFTAAAAGTLVPRAASAPNVAETVAAVGQKVTLHIDSRMVAEAVIRELPRFALGDVVGRLIGPVFPPNRIIREGAIPTRRPDRGVAVKLLDLEPTFVRYETRVETWDVVDGDPETWRDRGCPTKPVTGPRQYSIPVATLAEAQGIRFLCPACFTKNNGKVGTHGLDVTFAGRGASDDQGSHNSKGEPSRWQVSGDSFTNLTLSPSIDGGCWHGHITNGAIR